MTRSHNEPYESGKLSKMSAGQLLQKLYSYNDSTSPEIGALELDLKEADQDVDSIIEMIDNNGESFQSPKEGSNDHFTDLVGRARVAADENRNENALNLLDDPIIDILSDTVNTFKQIEEEIEDRDLEDSMLNQAEDIRNAFEYMLEMAKTAQEKLTSGK